MIPLVGAFLGGGASGILGGAAAGGGFGGLLGGLMNGASGGLFGMLSNLFGGGNGQQSGGANEQTNQLLSDIKDMMSQLLDQKGMDGGQGGGCGGSHGAPEAGHGCGGIQKPVEPMPEDGGHGCGNKPEPECGGHKPEPECGTKPHDCGGAEDAEWDGTNKSPSLDREQGAARLLEQAKNTDDPKEKRELIEMALEQLGDGPKKGKGLFGNIREKMDGNSYDKDIVKQAEKMLDQIDNGCLSECGESKAMDSVIDMLMEEGGVDGKPAANDTNGDGYFNKRDAFAVWQDRPMAFLGN